MRQGHEIVVSAHRQLVMTWHKKLDGDLTNSLAGIYEATNTDFQDGRLS